MALNDKDISFQVTLRSDQSTIIATNNGTAGFMDFDCTFTDRPPQLPLNAKWEVCLKKIIFSTKINYSFGPHLYKLSHPDLFGYTRTPINFTPKDVTNNADLVKAFRDSFPQEVKADITILSLSNGKIRITMKRDGIALYLTPQLCLLLGYPISFHPMYDFNEEPTEGMFFNTKGVYEANIPMNLELGNKIMFVHSNIIKPTICGRDYTDVLDQIVIPDNRFSRDLMIYEPIRPTYHAIVQSTLQGASIRFRNQMNQPLLYSEAAVHPTILTLHFKRKAFFSDYY